MSINQISKLQNILNELTGMFISRDDEIKYLLIASIARENLIFHGPPGCAKSDLAKEYAKRIDGANYFYKQMSADMSRSDLVGPVDPSLILKGQYRYLTKNYLPTAHIAVIDELPRASGVLLDDMLSILNHEGFMNGDLLEPDVLQMAMGTANTKLTGQHAANADRWLFRFFVEYLKTDQELEALDSLDLFATRQVTATMTLQDLTDLQAMIPQVKLKTDASVWEAKRDICKSLKANGLIISDRRFRKMNNAIAAHAIVSGRDAAILKDLEVLTHIIPDSAEQQKEIMHEVGKLANPFKMRALEIFDELSVSYAKVAQLFGKREPDLTRQRVELSKELYGKVSDALKELEDIQKQDPNEPKIANILKQFEGWQQELMLKGMEFRLGLKALSAMSTAHPEDFRKGK